MYQNVGFINSYDPEYVIILSQRPESASRTTQLAALPQGKGRRVLCGRYGSGLEGSPADGGRRDRPHHPVPESNLASMGIYIFNWDVLKKYLINSKNNL